MSPSAASGFVPDALTHCSPRRVMFLTSTHGNAPFASATPTGTHTAGFGSASPGTGASIGGMTPHAQAQAQAFAAAVAADAAGHKFRRVPVSAATFPVHYQQHQAQQRREDEEDVALSARAVYDFQAKEPASAFIDRWLAASSASASDSTSASASASASASVSSVSAALGGSRDASQRAMSSVSPPLSPAPSLTSANSMSSVMGSGMGGMAALEAMVFAPAKKNKKLSRAEVEAMMLEREAQLKEEFIETLNRLMAGACDSLITHSVFLSTYVELLYCSIKGCLVIFIFTFNCC